MTPRYLILLTFSRTVPSRVYEAWIFYIRFLVICIILHLTGWNLIPHFPCPASQLIYIFLNFQCVPCSLSFSVANTVIRKESYFRINVCWDIINVQKTTTKKNKKKKKKKKTRDLGQCPVGHKTKPGPNPICSVYNNSLLSVAQKRIYPFQCLPTYVTAIYRHAYSDAFAYCRCMTLNDVDMMSNDHDVARKIVIRLCRIWHLRYKNSFLRLQTTENGTKYL